MRCWRLLGELPGKAAGSLLWEGDPGVAELVAAGVAVAVGEDGFNAAAVAEAMAPLRETQRTDAENGGDGNGTRAGSPCHAADGGDG